MKVFSAPRHFHVWREQAREALAGNLPPAEVAWDGADEAGELFRDGGAPGAGSAERPAPTATATRVPAEYLQVAQRVACHRNPARWALLYRTLWRITRGERHLLRVATDPDVHALHRLDKEIRRDLHKMCAFVRFRSVQRADGDWFTAWFQPAHRIVRLNAAFFVDRFAQMRWSILTPDECAHWDGEALALTPGLKRDPFDSPDALEDLWKTYYGTIFNPARLKPKAMLAEMPKKYWANLPEAALIPSLLREAPNRTAAMLADARQKTAVVQAVHAEPVLPKEGSLAALSEAARHCAACPHAARATQAVFGEGDPSAEVVLLGEQPGDQEDRAGRPFVGPAGTLLDRALAKAGLDRTALYVTNAVKHFKWEPQGKRRLHQKPSARDIECCRPWFEAEMKALQPRILVCLGATAAQAVYGPQAPKVRDVRGEWRRSAHAPLTLVTTHPSAILRIADPDERAAAFDGLVGDLSLVADVVAQRRMTGEAVTTPS